MQTQRKRPLLALASVALGVAIVPLVASASGAAEPLAPFGPASNGSLVYEVDGDLWMSDATGASAVALITGPEHDRAPSFSHDGTRFSFIREGAGELPRLMVSRADGSGVAEVASSTDQSDWSPDDRQLTVNHDVDGGPSVSIAEADGTGIRTLDLGVVQPHHGWAAWRPAAGAELVFIGHPALGSPDIGLYGIAPDGTGLRTIGDVSTTESDSQISFQAPVLSPDGSLIAFSNWEVSDEGILDAYLHVRDLVTGEDKRVRARPLLEAEITPRFSPDGSLMVIEAQNEAVNESQLVVAPVDGSTPGVPIGPTFTWGAPLGFTFSPDGTQVLLTLRDGTSIIDVATGQTMATIESIASFPTWQRQAP